jgi:autotransporter-associated beta strand protein
MRYPRLPAFLRCILPSAALVTLGSSPALAATWYWDSDTVTSGAQQGSGIWKNGSSTWWDGANNQAWDNSAGNTAHFGTSTGVGPAGAEDVDRTITLDNTDAPVNAAGVILNSSTSGYGYILAGAPLSLADGSTISVAQVVNTDLNRRHQIQSSISGANININRFGLANSGNLAMLQLRGANTWTGNLTLSSGTAGLFVEAYNGTALNSLSSVSVGVNTMMILATADVITTNFSLIGNGAVGRAALRFDVTAGEVKGSVTLTGDASIAAASSITGIVSGSIGESGGSRVLSINPNNNGAVTLSGANTHTGGTILTAGTLNINNATALGTGNFTIGGGAINNGTGASLTLTNNNTQTWNGSFTFTGTHSLDLGTGAVSLGTNAGTARTVTVSSNNLTVGGVISNGTTATGLNKSGNGTLTFSGTAANTYDGLTTLNTGNLLLNKTAGVNAIAGNVTIAGGFLRFGANNQIANTAAVTMTGGGFNTDAAGALNGGLAGLNETIGSLAVSGSGVFSLNGAGTSFIVNGAASFTGGSNALFFMGSGGSFSADSLTVANMSRTTSSAVSNGNNSNGFVLYGNHGTQSAVRVGAGGLTLSGTTHINHIILRGGSGAVNGSKLSLNGNVTTTGTFASGIIRDTAADTSNGTTLVELAATGAAAVTRTFNVGGGGADLNVGPNVTITNGTSTSAGLTKIGDGTMTVAGLNTYTGTTTVGAGTFTVADGGALNGGGSLTIASGATFNLNSLGTFLFKIGGNGENNSINSTGTANLNGILNLNLSLANRAEGNEWQLVDASGSISWAGLQVTSTSGAFSENSGVWTLVDGATTWTFDQGSGVLSIVPEPSASVLILSGLAGFALRRRRMAGIQ